LSFVAGTAAGATVPAGCRVDMGVLSSTQFMNMPPSTLIV
jgi:hypothetical protein